MTNLYYILLKKLTQESKKLDAMPIFYRIIYLGPKEFQEVFWSWKFFFWIFITK